MTVALPTRSNPFVGPRAFQGGERLYGRERETRRIVDLLIAERIVLLYSPSGAGKTSLINAALVPELRAEQFQVSQIIRVGLDAAGVRGDVGGGNRYLLSVLLSLEQGVRPEDQRDVRALMALGLDRYVAERAQLDDAGAGNELLVFDQFEEILTADPTDEDGRRAFFSELGETLKNRGRWALFAMREDYLAGLDPYLAALPTKLRTRVRLDLLDDAAAVRAIQQPARAAGREITDAAARRLVDELRLVHAQRGDQRLQLPGPFVEPMQLQVVCRRVWEAVDPDIDSIDVEHVGAVGDVERALGDYYADTNASVATATGVPERLIRDWFDEDLITPNGFRAQVPHGPRGTGDSDTQVLTMLENAHIIRGENRRGTRWVELAHDRLVEPVKADNSRWRSEHLSMLQRQAALWQAEGRKDGLLLTGTALKDATAWAEQNPDELGVVDREFWDACVAARDARRRRRRLVVVAWTSSVLLAVLIALAVASASVPWIAGGPVLYGEDSTDVLTANLGDCLLIDDSNGGSLPRVPCNQQSAAELYAVTPIPSDTRYPDPSAGGDLDHFGAGACQLAFEDDQGASYGNNLDYYYLALVPDRGAWSAGHRDLYCLLDKADDSP